MTKLEEQVKLAEEYGFVQIVLSLKEAKEIISALLENRKKKSRQTDSKMAQVLVQVHT